MLNAEISYAEKDFNNRNSKTFIADKKLGVQDLEITRLSMHGSMLSQRNSGPEWQL